MKALEKLKRAVEARDSLLCVGLDPRGAGEDLLELNKRTIFATSDVACAYKFNLGFYLSLGEKSYEVLSKTLAQVPENAFTILDGKFGDIQSTGQMYAEFAFDRLGFDAVTVNPYMGSDAIEPFSDRADKMAFSLMFTSNQSSYDLQHIMAGHNGMCSVGNYAAKLACDVGRDNGHDNVGLVVGANNPDNMSVARHCFPEAWILTPGVGTQGGDLQRTVKAGLRKDGSGLLVNVGRGIMFSNDPAKKAKELHREINLLRQAT